MTLLTSGIEPIVGNPTCGRHLAFLHAQRDPLACRELSNQNNLVHPIPSSLSCQPIPQADSTPTHVCRRPVRFQEVSPLLRSHDPPKSGIEPIAGSPTCGRHLARSERPPCRELSN